MGHAEAFAIGDVVARYWLQRGYDVLHPIGWDSFGLPAENAAIKRDAHPADWTYANIETQAESFRRYAISLRLVAPAAHLRPGVLPLDPVAVPALLRAGAGLPQGSRRSTGAPTTRPCWPTSRSSPGTCERCGTQVTKRELTQWYFKITDYAAAAAGRHGRSWRARWPDRVLTMQRNWIGRSDGRARRLRSVEGRDEPVHASSRPGRTRCSARRSSWSPRTRRWPSELCAPEQRAAFEAYRAAGAQADRHRAAVRPTGQDRRLPGRHAINPVNGERIPVCAADYVLADYGTGAIMAVPAHDQRDLDFARTFGLPVAGRRRHRRGRPGGDRRRHAGDGALVNSGPTGRPDARPTAIARDHRRPGGATARGQGAVNFRLRDWLLSRQRFWGCADPDRALRRLRRGAGARRPAAGACCRTCAAPT